MHLNSTHWCMFKISPLVQSARKRRSKIEFPIDVGSLQNKTLCVRMCAERAIASWQCGTCFWNNFICEKFSRAEMSEQGAFLRWRSRGLWNVKRHNFECSLLFVLYPGVQRACLNTRAVELLLLLLAESEPSRALSLYTGVPYYFMWWFSYI
jgi:hypothetical protein